MSRILAGVSGQKPVPPSPHRERARNFARFGLRQGKRGPPPVLPMRYNMSYHMSCDMSCANNALKAAYLAAINA
jgi:hypothetical protein